MIVSALLAAATVAAPPPKPCPVDGRLEVSDRSSALLLRPQDRHGHGAQTLASLPPANLELTVIRSVDGCDVSTVVREKVQGARYGTGTSWERHNDSGGPSSDTT